MRYIFHRLPCALVLVASFLVLALLTGGLRDGPSESAFASDSQPGIAISGHGAGPQQVVCPPGLPWPIPLGDGDCDGFSTALEAHVGTLSLSDCGPGAWPPDINDDGSVDVIGDISQVASSFGLSPAPLRYDIGPEPAGDLSIDVISDISKIASFFGLECS